MSAPTPRTDALANEEATIKDLTPPYPVLQEWDALCRQLKKELAEAKNVQRHIVTMPDGSTVAAPCAISGCQYARPQESATPAAVVIVDAAGNSSVVLDSQFRAALTTGEHVLFARAYMNDGRSDEK